MARKSTCPISRAQFRAKARPVTVAFGDVPMTVPTKEFATGSFGWYLNGKTTVEIDGTPVAVQIGMTLTVIGSKELPEEPQAAPAPPAEAAPVQQVA